MQAAWALELALAGPFGGSEQQLRVAATLSQPIDHTSAAAAAAYRCCRAPYLAGRFVCLGLVDRQMEIIFCSQDRLFAV